MLALRLQRTGRKKLAQYRLVAQEHTLSPTSGKVAAHLGSYDPHTKIANFDKEKIEFYLGHGAQPSNRVAILLKNEGYKLPEWVVIETKAPKKVEEPVEEQTEEPTPEAPDEPATEKDEPVEEKSDNAADKKATEEKSDDTASEEATDKTEKTPTKEANDSKEKPENTSDKEDAEKTSDK